MRSPGPAPASIPTSHRLRAAEQVPRVAAVTGLGEDRVRELVAEHTEGRQLGFLGAERVNVLELNVALGLTAPGCNAVPAGE